MNSPFNNIVIVQINKEIEKNMIVQSINTTVLSQ